MIQSLLWEAWTSNPPLEGSSTTGGTWFGPLSSASKIGLARSRHCIVLSGEVTMRGFGAHHFRPVAQRPPISYSRRPGHREDAWIVDRELELQPLPLVVRVARKARVGPLQTPQVALAALF